MNNANEEIIAKKQIIRLLTKKEGITQLEISHILDISPQQVRKYFSKLKDKNYIHHIGSKKSGHWIVSN